MVPRAITKKSCHAKTVTNARSGARQRRHEFDAGVGNGANGSGPLLGAGTEMGGGFGGVDELFFAGF